jgi:hypothetical protein
MVPQVQVPTSNLTQLLICESERKAKAANVSLIVYLPDYSSMSITVKKSITFQELLNQILKAHKEQNLKPLLRYDQPNKYELRIHDGKFIIIISTVYILPRNTDYEN